ncbi:DUF3990 domain-containing protein [Bacillus cereus]|uniref:DUF3990 domain-containing protein n=1 Tax=Bacillus cereus group TaxID=86661 RepID=UPI000A3CAAD4|nr:DUF3990 domain-containing protein [Bacillus thuringiensis]MEB8740793.1 DUF3990 domain-containing protein [Bacillus cereus]MEB8909441.1 DUF3990 domain-containing protein [Bacillus cereus]MEB9925904.1 DUF3990 domain-containing protein [Bacillus cereus]MEB9986872.1 DUF3990 domain-containing protein [Bacillus cereus]MEB9991971.1 DUF3990 domain-containing protein [Bacillus cereus]
MKVVESLDELTTIWYHGTTSWEAPSVRSGINLDVSKRSVDFGTGFYLTSNPKQAWQWAVRKADTNNRSRNFVLKKAARTGEKIDIPKPSHPAVIKFEVDLKLLEKMNGKIFKEENDEWALFILENRLSDPSLISEFSNRDAKFHYVYGPLADGDIGLSVEDFEKNGNVEQFLKDIKGKRYRFPIENQLSVHTMSAVDCLKFKEVLNSEPKKLFSGK